LVSGFEVFCETNPDWGISSAPSWTGASSMVLTGWNLQQAPEQDVVILVVLAIDEERVVGPAAMHGVLLIGLCRHDSLP
jgi:hypothetical protein